MTALSIAVIGGSGFVGAELMTRLREHHRAWVVDVVPPIGATEYREADVTDERALVDAVRGADVVINLAAEHRDDVMPRRRYDEVNVDGAANTVTALQELGIDRLLFTSTVAVYGLGAGVSTEESAVRPFNDYGRTKASAEQLFRAWACERPERQLVIVRPSVIFGEHSHGNVSTLIDQITVGRFRMVGSGENKKSMAYVGNVAAFLEFALGLGSGVRLFNYADLPDMTMNELVDLVCHTLGVAPPRGRIPQWMAMTAATLLDLVAIVTKKRFTVSAVRVRKFCASTRLGADQLASAGFVPKVPLKDSLVATVKQRAKRRPGV